MDILEEKQRREPSKLVAEDGSSTLFQNPSKHLPEYIAPYPRRQYHSYSSTVHTL
jgi:hypothetical protein